MASKDWDKVKADYKRLIRNVDTFDLKTIKRLVAEMQELGKRASSLEDTLVGTLAGARKAGVDGDDVAAFKKFKPFYDAYKQLQSNTDSLYVKQKALREATNEARHAAGTIKGYMEFIDKKINSKTQRPDAGEMKEFGQFRREMDVKSKELIQAGDLMGRGIDRELAAYVDKFPKRLDKLLTLAPKSDDSSDDEKKLPPVLQEKALVPAVRKTQLLAKTIKKHCDVAQEKAVEDKNRAKPEMKAAAADLVQLKKIFTMHNGYRKKYEPQFRKSPEKKRIVTAIQQIEDTFKRCENDYKNAMTAIAKLK